MGSMKKGIRTPARFLLLCCFISLLSSFPAAQTKLAVICRPCGETPPPKGYSCAGQAMVSDSLRNDQVEQALAQCAPKLSTPASASQSVAPKSRVSSELPARHHRKRHKLHRQSPTGSIVEK